MNSFAGEESPFIMVTAHGESLFFLSQRDGESHAHWDRARIIEDLRAQRKTEIIR